MVEGKDLLLMDIFSIPSHPKVLPGNPDLDHSVPEILPVRATAVPGPPVTGSRAQCGLEQDSPQDRGPPYAGDTRGLTLGV